MKLPTVLLIGIACATGVAIALIILNYWNTPTACPEDSLSTAEMESLIAALDHRLQWTEKRIAKTTAHGEKVVNYVQSRTLQLDASEIKNLMSSVQDEAIRLALLFNSHPSPPFPGYPYEQETSTSYLEPFEVDDKLESKGMYWDDISYSKKGTLDGLDKEIIDGFQEPFLTDVEAAKLCDEWKANYSVVPGVSWGNLPFDLQQKWLHTSCDYHLTDSVAVFENRDNKSPSAPEDPYLDDFEKVAKLDDLVKV